MKKYIIIAAALATLASCSKNASLEVAPVAEDNAIGFSAYTGNAATKGTSYAVEDVIATDKGIGVFAFYQPGNGTSKVNFNSKKFATPDFMYNQQVKPKSVTSAESYTSYEEYNTAKKTSLTENQFNALPEYAKVKTPAIATEWIYTPVKYWPNNENDQISFFAYAPYDKDTAWEDLGFKTDVNATELTASFPVYNEKTAMKDYLFATPALNESKQKTDAKAINFEFKHIMSRIEINIGANVNGLPAEGPKKFDSVSEGTGTLITVESIVFKDIYESYDYTKTFGPPASEGFKANGKQDLTLSGDDFQNSTSASWTTDGTWYPLLSQEDSKPGYLFIAPQDFSEKTLVITYTVATTDKANPANNSTIKNVIEKEVGVNFASGRAYVLNLLIGMKTVDLSASMVDWTYGGTTQVNIPANFSKFSYFENGFYCGEGIKIGDVVWAPVNCGYHPTNFKYGKLYQWGRAVGSGYVNEDDHTYDDAGGIIQMFGSISSDTGLNINPDDDRCYGGLSPAYDWYTLDNAYKQLTCWPMKPGDAGYVAGKIDNPCPEGWRVPTKDELGNLLYTDWDPSADDGTTKRGSYDTTNKGWDFGNGLFFPAAGLRDAIDCYCYSRGNIGIYYSSSSEFYDDDDGPQHDKYFSYDFSFGYSDGSFGVSAGTHRGTACSVRCVLIQE